nr:hypothetical protein [Burkholderiales bacterium]
MPVLVVAAVAALASYGTAAALTGAVIAGITISATAASIIGAIVGAVVAYAGNALIASTAKKPSTAAVAADAKQMIRSSVEPRRVVYGRARVSGPIVYAESSGYQNERLSFVVPVAGHPCQDYEGIWLGETWIAKSDIQTGGTEVLMGPMAGKVHVFWYDGTQQAADPVLMSNPGGWSASDVLRGCAYFHIYLIFDENLFRGGIPNFSALVIGKNDISDPRDGTVKHSENWALVILDYLRSPMGLACTNDEIDYASFQAAANISDEQVQLNEEATAYQARYSLNGSFQLDRAPIEVMEEMIAAGGGALVYVQGQYRLYAGAYREPVAALNASHLAGPVQVQVQPARRERFNAVRGTFIDNRRNYTAAEFPIVSSPEMVAADGEQIVRDLDLPWIRDAVHAMRLAVLLLKKHSQGLTVTVPLRYASLGLSVMDNVTFTLDDFGWVAKPFTIIAYTYDPATGIISATMQEEQPTSYAWLYSEHAALPDYPDTNLVTPFAVPAPAGLAVSEALYATRDGAGVRTKAVLTWAQVPSPFINGHDVQFRLVGAAAWRSSTPVLGDALTAEVLDLEDGDYEFRIRARTSVSAGGWTVAAARMGGLAALPPTDITAMTGQISGGMLLLRWARHPDLDVRAGGRIEFRHHPDAGSAWANATSIGEAVPGVMNFVVLPLRAGTYFAKAVDAGGRYSANAAIFYTSQEGQLGYTNLLLRTYEPTFTGAYTDTVVTSSTLRLVSLGDVDSVASFDAIADLDGLGGITPSGRCFFSTGVNLGSPQRVRLTPLLRATVVNTLDQWDSRAGAIDTWASIDGVVGGEADAWLEGRYTTDNPAGTPVWSEFIRLEGGEFYMWAMQVRVQLRSYDPAFNIHIDQLRISAD